MTTPHTPCTQRWVTCKHCGYAGPRDCSSARHILANDLWSTSFDSALAASECKLRGPRGTRIRAAWEGVDAVLKRAQQLAMDSRVTAEANGSDPPSAWPGSGGDGILQRLKTELEAAEKELVEALAPPARRPKRARNGQRAPAPARRR